MSKFCMHCGTGMTDDARFCPSCGQHADDSTFQVEGKGAPPALTLKGWTARHLDPEVVARAEKNKRAAKGFTIFLTVVFPIGFALAGIFVDDMPFGEALIIGIGLGLLMLVIGLVRMSRMKSGTWDGTVTDKKKQQKTDHSQDDSTVRYKTVYTLVVTEESGKKHRLRYTDNSAMYNYFNVGDRIRCHMAFGTYEKFDKSRDTVIFCNICATLNDLVNDRCKSCRLPLFK